MGLWILLAVLFAFCLVLVGVLVLQRRKNKKLAMVADQGLETELTAKNQFSRQLANGFHRIQIWLVRFWKEVIQYPLYILTHPIQGYNDFKVEKKGKMSVAIFIILMYVLMEMIKFKYAGPVINTNNQRDFNSIKILIYGVVPVVLLAVSNWSVTTLMDGKGKMKEIFMMICYAFFPVVVLGFVNVALSNVITTDEAQFITLINIVAWAMTAYMVFMGLIVLHEYGIVKTIFSVLFTVVAACVIMFIGLLIFDLIQQMYGFVFSLYKEITTRFL